MANCDIRINTPQKERPNDRIFQLRTRSAAASRSPSTGSPSRPTISASVPRRFFVWQAWTLPSFDLGELVGKEHPQTKRFTDDEIVNIVKDARFISIRQSAPVA